MAEIETKAAEQRTAEWHADRAGKFTGSKFVDLMARNKRTGEKLASWKTLVFQVAVERLTGIQEEGPDSFSLRWGREVEPFACEAVELETGFLIQPSGFITHPKYPFAGCSPDGLIGGDGGLELKAPKNSAIHLERFLSGVPEEYKPQIQGSLWVTGRKWWLFASYDPRMPESHRLMKVRVERDEAYISELEKAVLEAEAEVQALLEQLQKIAA
jgi:predicted phage-related endonuclease